MVAEAMKTLILVRHAKSSWKQRGLPDRLRPLNKRGKRDAPMMGERLAKRRVEVDRVISSPATRALTTAEVIAEEIGHPWDEIVIDERLYHADADEILEVIQELPSHLDEVMLFGHNPGFTDLANTLVPHYIEMMPTCGVLQVKYDIDEWMELGEDEPAEVYFDYPKKEISRRR
jgi:phosphohistidine phosphatase